MYVRPVPLERRAEPPGLLALAGHPVRWRLLGELARSDRQVRELVGAVGEPQNLVSYHLARLRADGLVSMRRSSADGRDAYYRVNLARFEGQLAAIGSALHPGLRMVPAPPVQSTRSPEARGRVLFLCTGNSARSQMAEALLQQQTDNTVDAFSAGSHPSRLHPNAVRAMRERGIDIAGRRTKHLDEFVGQRFDYVVTLCDRVREICPEFPGPSVAMHWSTADPSAAGESNGTTYPAFLRTADELATRIRFFVRLIDEPVLASRKEP
jgi:ArsR family transcriptional regulator, arsenate/arsenite/antimonite-responsive transcriptional repressor / arsenate reductase (thioredoxin)